MKYYARLGMALLASLLLHLVLDEGMAHLEAPTERKSYRVTMAVTRVPPKQAPPEDEPPVEEHEPEDKPEEVAEPDPPEEIVYEAKEKKEEPKKRPKKKKKKKKPAKKKKPTRQTQPTETAQAEPNPNATDTTSGKGPKRRRFGVSMASTSTSGSGPAMGTGNTLDPTAPRDGHAGGGGDDDKGQGAGPEAPDVPVKVETVSRMPRIKGRCRGRYTPEARSEGLEGTVVLSVIVGPDGRTRDIEVVRGLGYGLDESAVKALTACRFHPGTKAGDPVAVRLRAFKIRYLLDDR